MKRKLVAQFVVGIQAVCLSACASLQINSNTLDIASSYDQLIVKQVVYNIKKTASSKYSIPAVMKVTAGTASTNNSITPSANVPIFSSITKGLTSAASLSSTRSLTFATPALSVGASNQWSQTYTLTPVIDSDQLRRLRLLYQYANNQISIEDFESNFPIIEATIPPKDDGPIYVRRTYIPSPNGVFSEGYTWVSVVPDVTFIRQPGCALCDYGNALTPAELRQVRDPVVRKNAARVRKLEKNIDLRSDWMYAPGELIDEDAVQMPTADLEPFYIRNQVGGIPGEGARYFYEFVLLTEDASSGGTGSPSSGGQSDGRKTAPLQRLSVPVAAGSGFIP